MGANPETVSHGEVNQMEWLNDSEASTDLDRIATVEIDNYHGITAKMILLYAVQTGIHYLLTYRSRFVVHQPYRLCSVAESRRVKRGT